MTLYLLHLFSLTAKSAHWNHAIYSCHVFSEEVTLSSKKQEGSATACAGAWHKYSYGPFTLVSSSAFIIISIHNHLKRLHAPFSADQNTM